MTIFSALNPYPVPNYKESYWGNPISCYPETAGQRKGKSEKNCSLLLGVATRGFLPCLAWCLRFLRRDNVCFFSTQSEDRSFVPLVRNTYSTCASLRVTRLPLPSMGWGCHPPCIVPAIAAGEHRPYMSGQSDSNTLFFQPLAFVAGAKHSKRDLSRLDYPLAVVSLLFRASCSLALPHSEYCPRPPFPRVTRSSNAARLLTPSWH